MGKGTKVVAQEGTDTTTSIFYKCGYRDGHPLPSLFNNDIKVCKISLFYKQIINSTVFFNKISYISFHFNLCEKIFSTLVFFFLSKKISFSLVYFRGYLFSFSFVFFYSFLLSFFVSSFFWHTLIKIKDYCANTEVYC
ncbi:transmembrane protein, putative [Medicago truncatula]|uniref:Transmembrane protein, putative n=1 Tax=Medicago truncatula TaxID=3880 RepID=A0A072V5P1_MEDTR|nr:transmembrane protein, putative [Medicago truncatula]